MRFRCRTCGGSYRDTNPDGTSYFHACPPLSNAELRDAGAEPAETDTRPRERPGRRDENLVVGPLYDREGRRTVSKPETRAEGRGRDEENGG